MQSISCKFCGEPIALLFNPESKKLVPVSYQSALSSDLKTFVNTVHRNHKKDCIAIRKVKKGNGKIITQNYMPGA